MQTRVDPNSLAIDSNALNGLKRSAQNDSPEAIRAAAKQFEAVLMNMMLKSMRDTVPQDGMTDSEQSRMFMGMLDQQLSSHLSQKGLGLADVLVKQLSKLGQAPEASQPGALPSGAQGATTGQGYSPLTGNLSALAAPAQKGLQAYQAWQATAAQRTDQSPESALAALSPLWAQTPTQLQSLAVPAAPLLQGVRQASGKVQQFIQNMLPHATAASESSGIPAKFMLGQAALESGWGKHEIKTSDGSRSYNLFGIKADSRWTGKVANSVTTEYIQGVKHTRVEKFRAYDSYSDAFKDYASLITENPRYQQAMDNTHDAQAYAQALQQAGYATDPQYGRKLAQVIQHLPG